MQDPEPDIPKPGAGWVPTNSTIGGAALGGAIAQVIVASIDQLAHISISNATASAITVICIFAVGYFFKDGGRK